LRAPAAAEMPAQPAPITMTLVIEQSSNILFLV